DGAGTLTDTGEVMSAGGPPNNVLAAPGGATGVVITRPCQPATGCLTPGTVTSFTIPGLTPVNTRTLSGFGISGVISPAGDRLFVRTDLEPFTSPVPFPLPLVCPSGATVDVFTYNAATGAIGASVLFS